MKLSTRLLYLPSGVLIASCLLLLAPNSSGASIGVRFLGDSPIEGAAGTADWLLSPADTAGVVPQSHWNQIETTDGGDDVSADTGISAGLTDASGAGTAVQLIYAGNDAWNAEGGVDTPNDKLMKGTLKRFGSEPLLLTFTNLNAGSYDVYVYGNVDGGPVTLDISVGANTNVWVEPAAFDAATGFVEAENGIAEIPAEGNYVKFSGISPTNKTITVSAIYRSGGNGLGISAVQLVTTGNFPVATPATTLTALTQVQDINVYAGSEASFVFTATNNAIPPVTGTTYQWFRNGQLLTNVTGPAFTFLATQADQGAQIHALASLPAQQNPNQLSLASATGRVTVLSPVVVTNGLKVEFFPGATREDVEVGRIFPSSNISVASSLEFSNSGRENYTRRISGYFLPPTDGAYVFFLAADDDTDLFLSTDADPNKKRLIAQEENWSNLNQWLSSAGDSAVSQKRSDQFSPDGGSTIPFSSGISLTANQPYYVEAVQHQGVGGDNVAVTYKLLEEADPEDATSSRLQATNHNIAYLTRPSTNLSWFTQPTSVSTTAGQQVSFTATASSDSEFQTLYQWYQNGAAVTGATLPTHTFSASTTDDNSQWFAVAHTGGGLSITSAVVNLTVLAGANDRAVITFSDQVSNDEPANPGVYTDAQGLPQGVTATFKSFNNWNGDPDHTPTGDSYLLYGAGTADEPPSIIFNIPVEVPSFWVTSGPFGQDGVASLTAYLGTVEKFRFTLTEKNMFLQVTNGAGILIDRIVFADYNDSEIDDITIIKPGGPTPGTSRLKLTKNAAGLSLSWTGVGTLQESSDLKAWQTAGSQSNPQNVSTSGARKFYRIRQ